MKYTLTDNGMRYVLTIKGSTLTFKTTMTYPGETVPDNGIGFTGRYLSQAGMNDMVTRLMPMVGPTNPAVLAWALACIG